MAYPQMYPGAKERSDADYNLTIAVIGAKESGKSALCRSYLYLYDINKRRPDVEDEVGFYKTMGWRTIVEEVGKEEKRICVKLCERESGRYGGCNPCETHVDAILITFDKTDPNALKNVRHYIDTAYEKMDPAPKHLSSP